MKKAFIFCCLFFLFIQFANGQKTDTAVRPSSRAGYDMYVQQSRANYTAALVLLGVGVGMTATGTAIYLDEALQDKHQTSAGPLLFYFGAATALFSIPFFIRSASYKRRAKLSITTEPALWHYNKVPVNAYTAVALTIQLTPNRKKFKNLNGL